MDISDQQCDEALAVNWLKFRKVICDGLIARGITENEHTTEAIKDGFFAGFASGVQWLSEWLEENSVK